MNKPKMSARVWMGLIGALVALVAAVVIPTMLVKGPANDGQVGSGVVSGESGARGVTADRAVTGTETKQKIDDVVRWLFIIAGVSGVLTVFYAWHTSPRRRVRLAGWTSTGSTNTEGDADGAVPEASTHTIDSDVKGKSRSMDDPDELPIPQRPERVVPPMVAAVGAGHEEVASVVDPTTGYQLIDGWPSGLGNSDEVGQEVGAERLTSKLFPRRRNVPSAPNPRPERPDDARSPEST